MKSLSWKVLDLKKPELSLQLLFSKGKCFKERSTEKFIWMSIIVGIFFSFSFLPAIKHICFAWGRGHVILTIGFIFHPLPPAPPLPTTDILCDSCAKCSTENGKLQIIKVFCLWSSLVNLLIVFEEFRKVLGAGYALTCQTGFRARHIRHYSQTFSRTYKSITF